MQTFNDVLRHGGIAPEEVRLVRHKDTQAPLRTLNPFTLWQANDGRFERYQSIQVLEKFRVGDILASFVVTPAPENKTLFVGLWRVRRMAPAPAGTIDPVHLTDAGGCNLYDLVPDSRLAEYRGQLFIEWGDAYRTWVQHAHRNEKRLLPNVE